MAIERLSKRHASLLKSKKFRDRLKEVKRKLHLEQLEDRRVMATTPVFILPNNGDLLADGQTRNVAPQDLTFRFADVPGIDPSTIAGGIKLVRANKDGQFDPVGVPGNDITITPGFIGLGNNNREVIMRFTETLPDDIYRIMVIGAGPTPLKDTAGNPFNPNVSGVGQDYTLNFRLDLGAQVIAVVPQPVRKITSGPQAGQLAMDEILPGGSTRSTRNQIWVYFNNDDLNKASAENKDFYRLYVTQNTLDPSDDIEITPDTVEYDATLDRAKLIFSQPLENYGITPSDTAKDPSGSFRLRIGTNEVRRASTDVTRLGTSDPQSTFAGALDLGSLLYVDPVTGQVNPQGRSVAYAQAIEAQPYSLDWPGGNDEPGHRQIGPEAHLSNDSGTPTGSLDPDRPAGGINVAFDTTDGITTVYYNFQPVIGTIPNGQGGTQPAFNLITETQKQRAREIFELYNKYAGLQFVETEDSGLTIATGDLRVIDPNAATGPGGTLGIASPLRQLAIMDNGEVWNDQYGENWFQVAMHEIGHLLGQGHTTDLPITTIQVGFYGGGISTPGVVPEPIFPGDHDIVHMQHMFRPEGKDIDMYRFQLDATGIVTIETFAERLQSAFYRDAQNNLNPNVLDTQLRLYRVGQGGVMEEIAQNDDYFSKDSLIQLTLSAGTYWVGVSAAGNNKYDPNIADSGIGGTTQGNYEIKIDFRKSVTSSIVDATTTGGVIADTQPVAFDGDADGIAGGVYNFWFRAAAPRGQEQTGRARTLFVDKSAPAGGNGSLTQPYNNIQTALSNARKSDLGDGDIVRIVGNDPLGNDGTTAANRFADNLAYRIGFDDFGNQLPDGADLQVPKGVAVMIDAGAIFQMRRSQVSVGSTAPSIASDRSGGSLQILGTPTSPVYFTSYNELGANSIGTDTNPLSVPPAAADWGGISFKNDIDRADGRFDYEDRGIFLNYVNHANIRYGGGQVNVDSVFQVINPIHMTDARPTVTFNTITRSGDAAMSANPDSFEETNFQAPKYFNAYSDDAINYIPSTPTSPRQTRSFTLDYDRVGPDIHGNKLVEPNTSIVNSVAVVGTPTIISSSDSRTSFTQSHVVPAGSDRLLVVSVMANANTDVSSITYGGAALQQAVERDSGVVGGTSVEIWYLVAPAVGTSNLVINFSTAVDPTLITVTNLTGVNQLTPIGATSGGNALNGTAATTNLTTTATGSLIFGAAAAQGGDTAPFTPGTNVVELWDRATGTPTPSAVDDIGGWGGTRAAPTLGTYTLNANFASVGGTPVNDDWAMAAIEIRSLGESVFGNSKNGLFIRTRTPAGNVLEELTVAGRFDDTDIVHILEENLVVRGTPGGPILEQTPPPVDLIITSAIPSGGNFSAGEVVEYKLTYVDLLGNESLASETFSLLNNVPVSGTSVMLENLPNPAALHPDFVARRLYRRNLTGGQLNSGQFELVAQIPASVTSFTDTKAPTSGNVQALRVLGSGARLLGSDEFGNLFAVDLATGAATTLPSSPLANGAAEIESDPTTGRSFWITNPANGNFLQEFDPASGAAVGFPIPLTVTFDALEFANGILYGVSTSVPGGPSTLQSLNPANGAATAIGLTGVGPITGLAHDVTTGVMYAVTDTGNLYSINLSTGVATFVGSSGIALGSLEFGPDGNLYAGSTGNAAADGLLYRVDKNTGAATLIGDTFRGDLTGLTTSAFGAFVVHRPRLDASLVIDPSIIVKSDSARIEVGMGANLIAEGQLGQEIILTSIADDRYGAGGTFDTPNDNFLGTPQTPAPGDWGGIFHFADSKGSIDNAVFAYAGGLSRVEGSFAGFNPIEIHQATVRVAESKFEFNDDGQGGQAPTERFGRGFNREAMIFVRGAQPVIVDNIAINNDGAFIDINANALTSATVVDWGRQLAATPPTPPDLDASEATTYVNSYIQRRSGNLDNNGPLVKGNRLRDNELNGMTVRGGSLTTEVVWDDTDIVHLLFEPITVHDFHVSGGLRLESSATESLVVKASGANAGFTATGRPLEIDDRIGGIVQILGQPGFPVVLSSLTDDTVGAGFTPEGDPQVNTDGTGVTTILPTGAEVSNGTLIDNDVAPNIVGHFEAQPGPGGSMGAPGAAIGVTAQGQTMLFANQNFLGQFINYIDIGPTGGAIDLSATTVTTPPTLLTDDLVYSEGFFLGSANQRINWRVETRLDDGRTRLFNTLTFSTPVQGTNLGVLRYINYLDQAVGGANDDLLFQSGSPGTSEFRLMHLDNQERVGLAQGGAYAASSGLLNATYNGFTADRASDLQTNLTDTTLPGTTFSPTGNIDLGDLPAFVDPALGVVNGLNDLTTAMQWTVNPTASTATITTFLDLISRNPISAGTPGEWQGVTFAEYAHDRNVETILEQEGANTDGTVNSIPPKAQFIGSLAPNEKSGDENLRLGFTVQGLLNRPSDVDVYSFSGKSGTEVWIDVDRTTHSADTIVELIDNNGVVLARSNNSEAENAGGESLLGIARKMQKTPPYEGQDFYTTNPRDPAFRVVLPGPANTTNTYFLRVRSSADATVTELAPGGTAAITTVVEGAANSATELMRGGSPTIATVIQGGSGSSTEIVKGITAAAGTATNRMVGGNVTVTTTVAGNGTTNEQQQFSFGTLPTAGTFTLSFNGQTTGPIAHDASDAAVRLALEGLSNVDPGDVSVTKAANVWTVTFTGPNLGNRDVPQLVASNNEIQRFARPTSAFTLNFDGQRTSVLAATATAAEIQAALEALSNISPGDVVVTISTSNVDVEFTGVYANQNVAQLLVSDREIQRISVAGSPTAGTFVLRHPTAMIQTGPIAVTATATGVQAALDAAFGPGRFEVTGNASGPWDIAFQGADYQMDVNPLDVLVNEIQSFTLPSLPPAGGTFTLTLGTETTTPLAFNATPATIEAALEAFAAIDDVLVTYAGGVGTVTFRGIQANMDVAQLTGAVNEVQRITNPVPGGRMTLSFNGQVTTLLPKNATAADVQAALEGLANINVGDIAVTSGGIDGPYDVTFLSGAGTQYGNQNVPEIVILDSQIMQAGAAVVSTPTQGSSTQNEQQLVTLQGGPVGGAFRLSFITAQQTPLIPFNASTNDVRLALEALDNINPGDVAIGGFPGAWTVTFGGQYANLNVAQLVPATNEFQRIPAPAPGTAISVTFNGQTAALPVNATPAQVQAALQALSTIGANNVAVTGSVGGPWDVEFTGTLAGADRPAMSLGQDEVQRISVPATAPPTATFTLTFGGQTTVPIAYGAIPSTVQNALQNLSSIGAGNVLVTAATGGGWDIRFAGALSQRNVAPITITRNDIQQITLRGNPTGGTFTLRFDGQTTTPLAHNATNEEVQTALEALANIAPGDVLVLGNPGGPWTVEFRGAYAGQNARAITADASGLIGGLTSGSYQMQVRLREVDEFGGSTVRFAKIANAVNGIRVIGQPTHSPLTGERTDTGPNDTQGAAQYVGNLLTTDRGTLAIAGNSSSFTDVDWYRFDVDYREVQSVGTREYFDAMFDLDYADGLARPNLQFYVFDSTGRLILTSRNSNVAEDRPGPAPGSGISDLTRGSAGVEDPFVGNFSLYGSANGAPAQTFYVAVTNVGNFPAQINQFNTAGATSPLFRLEPLPSVKRIVEDHINEGSFDNPLRPDGTPPRRGTSDLPEVEVFLDASSEVPFNLGDVVMYIARDMTGVVNISQTDIVTVDPFTGENETWVGRIERDIHDIDLRTNELLYGLARDLEDRTGPIVVDDDESGNYFQIDTGNGTANFLGDDGIETFELDPAALAQNPPQIQGIKANLNVNNTRWGYGIQYNAMTFVDLNSDGTDDRLFAVGNRGEPTVTTNEFLQNRRNLIYQLNPDNGSALATGAPLRIGGAATSAFEIGEILTAPTLTIPQGGATLGSLDLPTPSPSAVSQVLDGQTFDVSDGANTRTFEFESGPEIFQTVRPGVGQVIRDGMFFILDQNLDIEDVAQNEAIFQFETGEVIAVVATSGADLTDGATFTVNAQNVTRTFEFDLAGSPAVVAGNIAVPYTIGASPFLIAQNIAQAINSQTGATWSGSANVQANSTRVNLISTLTPTPGFVTVNLSAGVIGDLEVQGGDGAAPVLEVPAGTIADGENFVLQINSPTPIQFTFEFDNPDAPGYVPGTTGIAININNAMTRDQIADAMATAIDAQAGLTGERYGHRVVVNGKGIDFVWTPGDVIINLMNSAEGGFANVNLIQMEEHFTDAQLVPLIVTTVNSTPGFSFSASGEAGATQPGARINFPPLTGPGKVAAQVLDASGMIPLIGTAPWQVNTLAQFGPAQPGSSNILIPFGAADPGATSAATPANVGIANRIATAINTEMGQFGIQATVVGGTIGNARVTLSGGFVITNAGTPFTAAGEGPGGDITGLVQIDSNDATQVVFLAVSNVGGLYVVQVNWDGNLTAPVGTAPFYNQGKSNFVLRTEYIGTTGADFEGLQFQGLTLGPQNVEGGRYRETFFAVADEAGVGSQSRLYAFNFDWLNDAGQPDILNVINNAAVLDGRYGGLAPIFVDGQTSVPLFTTRVIGGDAVREPLTNARGVVFSNLDQNLWQITPFNGPNHRQGDQGHGVNAAPDLSRPTDTGHSSYYFGRGGINTTYNFPGGAYGSLVSNEFSLVGYSQLDQPVLYFNYFAAAEVGQDQLRVFVSGTGNENRDISGDGLSDTNSGQWQQLAVTSSNVFVNTGGWRQVRIPLNAYVGMENLRLRFDFSTSGEMNVGDRNTTGEELRAVAGEYITDGQFIRIDGQNFEFDLGYSIFTTSGRAHNDGERFTIDNDTNTAFDPADLTPAITFEFDKNGSVVQTATLRALNITDQMSAAEVAQVIINAINASALAASITPRFVAGAGGQIVDNQIQLQGALGLTRTGVGASPPHLTQSGAPGLQSIQPGALPNIPLLVHRAMNRVEVANVLDAALEAVIYDQKLIVNNGSQYLDGQVFELSDGVTTRRYEFESGLVMAIPTTGAGGGGVVDEDTFTIDPDGPGPVAARTFEFDNNSTLFDTNNVQIIFGGGNSQGVIATAVANAINATFGGTGVNAMNARVVAWGGGTLNYIQQVGVQINGIPTPVPTLPNPIWTTADYNPNVQLATPISIVETMMGSPTQSEMQTITLGANARDFSLTFHGQMSTTTFPVTIDGPTLQNNLIAQLQNLSPGDITITGGAGGPFTVTFGGQYANVDVPLLGQKFNTNGTDAGVQPGNTPVLFSPTVGFFAADVARSVTEAINNPIVPPGMPAFPGLAASFNPATPSRVRLASNASIQLNVVDPQPSQNDPPPRLTNTPPLLPFPSLPLTPISLESPITIVETVKGAPAVPGPAANEVQTITAGGTGNPFTLTFNGQTTGPIAETATAAQLQAALVALNNINPGDIIVGGGNGVWTVTFVGQYMNTDVSPLLGTVLSDLVKQDGDLIRLIGHSVDVVPFTNNTQRYRGPFGLTAEVAYPLPGDVPDSNGAAPEFDGYRSNLRGQNNNFEGIYIDDIIIGLAERGEMGTNTAGAAGATDTTFNFPPNPPAGQIVVGDYQLEVRQGPGYEFVDLVDPGFTANSNDRLTENYTLNAPRGAQLRDGQTFTISDGINRVTFEFNDTAVVVPAGQTAVAPGNQRVDFNSAMDNHAVARAMRDAINSAPVQAAIKVLASIGDGALVGEITTSARVNLVGAATMQIQGIFAPEVNDTLPDAIAVSPIGAVYNGAQWFAQGTIGDNPVLTNPDLGGSRDTQDDDVDLFKIVLNAGQRIRIDIDARSLGSTFKNEVTYASTLDSILRVFNAAGLELAVSDDTSAPGESFTFDSYLEFIAPAFGTYYIGISGYNNTTYNPVTGVVPAGNYSTGFYQLEITSALPSAIDQSIFIDTLGDQNLFRDQGQILLYGNEIRSSQQWGILVDSGARLAADGNAPHSGPVRNLREPNVGSLVPGIVIANNTIYDSQVGGIRYSGEVAPDAPVPFGRIINNTLFGNGGTLTPGNANDVGIQVDERASPTLMNNIVANFAQGINVDATSNTAGTVLGGMLFQGNVNDSNVGLGGDFPVSLTNQEPLFVNSQASNFYLKALSRAIDSSVDSLLDRPSLVTVKDPLEIARSPLLAPDRDGVGQLRVDDPTVSTPQGVGLNPFKDRGAVDRVDFTGPTSQLINPQDNDSSGIDLDPTDSIVVLQNQIVRDFSIRLLDRTDPNGPPEGSDLDDFSLDGSKVVITTLGATPTILQEGTDYTYSYDATNNIIRLTPIGGIWDTSTTYRITLDNSASTGIRDKAGNILQANQLTGEHHYTIFLGSAVDWGDLPDTSVANPSPPPTFKYPTRNVDNGASHQIVGGFHLGTSNGADADGGPSLNADSDAGDDGLVSFLLQPGATSHVTVVATFTGVAKLDAWIDLNQDGDFIDASTGLVDAGEYVIAGVTLTSPGAQQVISFSLPDTALRGDTYARFRMSSAGVGTPTGPAPDGEVEDYKVTLVGPPFQNGLRQDVNNDGFVSGLDLIVIINLITLYGLPTQLPPPSDPNLDPSGGGGLGNGQYVDVDGNGQMTIDDLTAVIDYIVNGFQEPPQPAPLVAEGEGEGEGSLALLPPVLDQGSSAKTGDTSQASLSSPQADLVAPAVLYATSSIVIEERVVSTTLEGDSWTTAADDALDLLAADLGAAYDPAPTFGSRIDSEGELVGPLEEEDWEALLTSLALDAGGLPGGDEHQE